MFGVILLYYIFLFVLTLPLGRVRDAASSATDTRLNVTKGFLSGIRVIKAYAWEGPMKNKLNLARDSEKSKLLKMLLIKGTMAAVARYAGIIIFLPLVIIQLNNGNKL